VLKQTQCSNVRVGNDALNEAKTLQSLKHLSVVQYLDVFLHSSDGYLVVCTITELCDRGDLAAYLRDKKRRSSPLNEQVVRSWLSQLTDGLKYLHERKIVHRDLKPHNVFLTSDGILKIGDFGLSATLMHGMRTTHVGTPCYLAPEVMNHQQYGEAVDVWGVGCIGLEMMTLEFLWEKKGLLAAEVKKTPKKIDSLPDRFSPALRECVVACLAYEPKDRPSTTILHLKIRSTKNGGDDTLAIFKALEGFMGPDAALAVADSLQKGFESFSGWSRNLFGGGASAEESREDINPTLSMPNIREDLADR